MSSISVLQAPGPGQVTSVKTNSSASSPAPSTTSAGTAAATADSGPQYTSPRFELDPQTDRVILEYRNAQSGSPEYQVPSKAQLLLYQGTQSQGTQTQASPGAVPTAAGSTAV
jgi:hypothetical protein